jgi:quercetin dioxygenase-like cupin family protein
MDAIVLTDSEGETYDAGPVRMRVLAQAPDQPISVTDNIMPSGFPGPVWHRHAQMTDVFYVLEGEVELKLEGERRVLGPGSFALVPPGVVHTFANPGPKQARVLNIQQPAGLEQYLKEAFKRMAEGHPWSPAEMAQIASQYDFEPVAEEATL